MATWRCEISLLVFLLVLSHEIFSRLEEKIFLSPRSHVISSTSVNRTSTRLVCVKQVESFILLFKYTGENHLA